MRQHWFRLRRGRTAFFAGCWLCGIAALLALTSHAHAQAQPDVEIELEQFGVGSTYREGDITGVRLRLTNNPAGTLDEVVTVWVHIELPNADGDIGQYGRVLTLTRGRPRPAWIAVPLPPGFESDRTLTVRVFEMTNDRRGREITARRISPRDVRAIPIPIVDAKIGVIGQRVMGLRALTTMWDRTERPVAAHEATRVVTGLRPDTLPDTWEMLRGFEAIAWADASPRDLTSETARALRDYVRNGGHLIINLPEDTNPWQFGVSGQHQLEDMLPRTEPRKDEAVSIRDLVPVLSKARSTRDVDFAYGIRVFKDLRNDFNAIDNHYEPLIALPDGRVVAVRRTFGHGWITVIGIDLAQSRLYGIPLSNGSTGLPQPDAFWNRVLGRRADTPTGPEVQALDDARLLMRSPPGENHLGEGSLVTEHISMTAQAGKGLLLAFLLFAAYWVLAGPGGFGLLKMYGKVKHAWLAFAAASIAFTAVAWASVSVLRINEARVTHLTVLDHIARPSGGDRAEDPQLQRAVSWFSLYTPRYGSTPIGIDSMDNRRDLLLPWTPPGQQIVQAFSNVDRFAVDVRNSQNAYSLPSRATSTMLYAHWMGGIDTRWGSMIREEVNRPIEVQMLGRAVGRTEDGLRGILTHGLPTELRDVTIIWVRNLRSTPRRYAGGDSEEMWVPNLRSGEILNRGYMMRLERAWRPADPLDLSTLDFTPMAALDVNITQRYVDEYRQTRITGITQLRASDRRRYLEMLSFFNQLTPPRYFKARPEDQERTNEVTFQRMLGRELDLSPWLTRPCLIILGYLDDSELPIPLQVGPNGEKPASTGVTLVRWIYPLPLEEDIAFPPPIEDEFDDSPTSLP
jgi:hypothetical protein